MTTSAIRVEGLSKQYSLAGRRRGGQTFREAMLESVKAPLRSLRRASASDDAEANSFWALKDVSFEIAPGEVVGIIGRNGAGKSTLLKILSRITAPTSGRVEIRGRIASLLEVGTGFHPELTGRENIRLNGAILGMSGAEIARKFDEIVTFSGVEKFIDMPVKRYSSGMQVRLAFAVAAHLDPEILLVDEVLAVGDAEFQNKCLGKMGEIAGRGGRTVLFVSHQLDMVNRLCARAFLLHEGSIANSGDTGEIIEQYYETHRSLSKRIEGQIGDLTVIPAVEKVEFSRDWRLDLTLSLMMSAECKLSEACILLYSSTEQRIALVDLRISDERLEFRGGVRKVFNIVMDPFPIVSGQYRLSIWIRSNAGAIETNLGFLSVPANNHPSRLSLYPDTMNGVVQTFGEIQAYSSVLDEKA